MDQIPFFDSSFLCEPATPTAFTTFEEEVEPWDAPLRRRNNVSSHIRKNLYHDNRRESHYSEIGSDDGVLVNEPFSRDPTVKLKKIKARKYESSPRGSVASLIDGPVSPSVSPTSYSKPSMSNLRDMFGIRSGDAEPGKKRAAPKPPGETFSYLDRMEQQKKKGPAPPPPAPRADPIREMESIGRKNVRNILIFPNSYESNCSQRRVATNRRSISKECYGRRSTIVTR